jgi:hypothetical protein
LLPEAGSSSRVGDTEAGAAGHDTKSCRLTYSGIGGEDKGGAQVLKLASDIYRVEVKLTHRSNFRKVSNHAEIYAFRLFVCCLKIVTDIIVVFRRDQLGRETTTRKCIGYKVKVLLPLPSEVVPIIISDINMHLLKILRIRSCTDVVMQ